MNLKNFTALWWTLLFPVIINSCRPQSEPSKIGPPTPMPNVILVITDDQGYGDLGLHGNPFVRTPTLDSLARISTRLTSFYVSPVCAPTRSSLMTGRYSLRTGVYDTYNGGAIMASNEITLAEALEGSGYVTGMFGKWHLGDTYPHRPQDQGFTHSLVHPSGGMGQVGDVANYFKFDSAYFNPTLWEDGVEVKKKGYCSDIFTQGAIKFIADNQDNPFFLYLSYNAPHTPLQLPQDYHDEYADARVDNIEKLSEGRSDEMTEKDIDDARRVYGMVSNIDDNLRRLFGQINDLRLRENTLVIFITDNGPQQRRYNSGLRGLKGSVYEGGIRVPCFMTFPSRLPQNQDVGGVFGHIDIFPTILGLCGLDFPQGVKLDGKDIMPVITGDGADWLDRPMFSYWSRGYPQPYRNIAVRKGDYKLVGHASAQAGPDEFELFNIADDPYEMNSLNGVQDQKLLELKNEFDSWHKDVISSPNLGQFPRIHLGTDFENPVTLNRNDAKVPGGIWAEESRYSYWDVTVSSPGEYSLSCYFKNKLALEGDLSIRIGTVERTINNRDTTSNLVKLKSITLTPGDYRFESWYRALSTHQLIYPFYVKVEKLLKGL